MPLVSSLIVPLDEIKNQLLTLSNRVNNNTSPQNKKISVIAAVTLAGLFYIYRKIIIPPPQLRHLPRANFFKYISFILSRRPYDETLKEITGPLAAATDHGMYAVS